MDELTHIIKDYIEHYKAVSILDLHFYIMRYAEFDHKDNEIIGRLVLLKRVYERNEQYEYCAKIQRLIKENETTDL